MESGGRRNNDGGRGRGRNSGHRGSGRARGRGRSFQRSSSGGRFSGEPGGAQIAPPPGLYPPASQLSEAAPSSSPQTGGRQASGGRQPSNSATQGQTPDQGVNIPSRSNNRCRASQDRDFQQGSQSRSRNSRFSNAGQNSPAQSSPSTPMRQNNVVPIPNAYLSGARSGTLPNSVGGNSQQSRPRGNRSRYADTPQGTHALAALVPGCIRLCHVVSPKYVAYQIPKHTGIPASASLAGEQSLQAEVVNNALVLSRLLTFGFCSGRFYLFHQNDSSLDMQGPRLDQHSIQGTLSTSPGKSYRAD